MKILPISNIYDKQQFRPSFKEISDDGYSGFYDYSVKRTSKPVADLEEAGFVNQNIFDRIHNTTGDIKCRQKFKQALFDMDLNKIEDLMLSEHPSHRNNIISEADFSLGLAEIPLNDNNKSVYKRILKRMVDNVHGFQVNCKDKNDITLLEKVMNAENEPYLNAILDMSKNRGIVIVPASITYDSMQKFAFDNIQNAKFKEQCMNLPIKFYDIVNDVKIKDLISLDKHIQEQMRCGFCDLKYAFMHSIYYPALTSEGEKYTQVVSDIFKKHFPKFVI